MPEFPPSIIKPTDAPKLRGAKAMNQEQKAKAYDGLRPGLKIPEGQKAERFELMCHRNANGTVNRRRSRTAGSMSVPELPWMVEK